MAAAQLGKVETLIGIGQYESARLQLRQGAASTIRLDLKAYDRSRHTGPDEPQVDSLPILQCLTSAAMAFTDAEPGYQKSTLL